ncbi:hypothetical protein CHS0354_036339 [Potamilus streckersoni]|uniref:Uncharacterized protein n=1 Tax=Potamilus streckersoni TaxID=2493646 RepID=A0AAE0VTW9_9BIVA|nr:hypothetical protein CHS0354_036339 [Potamilus streckersoni]
MESTYRMSSLDIVRYVRGEFAGCLCDHNGIHFVSDTKYKKSLKPSSMMKSLKLSDSDRTGVKKVKTSTENLPSRWPRNTDLVHAGKASIRNADGHKYEVEEQKFTGEKEQERKLKHYKPSNVEPFISMKDAQYEKKQQDVEIYLDTALQGTLTWPDGLFSTYSRKDPMSDKNSRYEVKESNDLCNSHFDCNPNEVGRIINNQSTNFSQECTGNLACAVNVCHESDLSIDNASLDSQYTSDCSACTNSIQNRELGRFLLLKKPICINIQKDLLCTNTNNTKSAEFHSDLSEILSESVNFLRFRSLLLDREGEPIKSIQPLVNLCKSNSLENAFYSTQSKLPEVLPQIQSMSSHTVPSSPYYSPEEFNTISLDGCSESQFSSQREFSHSDTLQKGLYRDTLISPPAECIEISELPCFKDKRESCFSTHVESCQCDSFNKSMNETSLLENSKEAVYVTPDVLAHCDKEMESNTFRNLMSDGQRQPEMKSLISYQMSKVKSHDLVFFKTTNSNLLLKSKVTFDDSTFKKGHKTGRLYMATTDLGEHENPHLLRPEVICERLPRQINVQNRVYYWHQVMQLYFNLKTALTFGGSLKWLFQLRPVTLQALQKLQSKLSYPFTNLNEFFNCESRESPASAEECMSVEWMRLQTFQNYPVTGHGSPIRLAREGFFYTGQGTQTRCFSCGVSHGEWKFLDNPREVHQRLSPNCPFLNGRQGGHRNIPMSPDGSGDVGRADMDSIPPPSLPIAPLPGTGTGQGHAEGNGSLSTEVPRASKTTAEDQILPQQNLESGETSDRMHSHPVEESAQSEADNRPKFPEHVPLPSRIATFSHGWPPYLDQTPQQMAEAGFFFTGNQDYTRCYQCGGGLRNWEPGDNPWIEHCRWYPTCPHVEKGKGQRFVKAVLKKQAELVQKHIHMS